jgi:hypothetical protein
MSVGHRSVGSQREHRSGDVGHGRSVKARIDGAIPEQKNSAYRRSQERVRARGALKELVLSLREIEARRGTVVSTKRPQVWSARGDPGGGPTLAEPRNRGPCSIDRFMTHILPRCAG